MFTKGTKLVIMGTEVIRMGVKNNLRLLMAERNMNIQDVSDATGLSRKSISKLYNETSIQITFDVIEKLCTLFDCEVGDLLVLEKDDKK
jgi:putative transcriptional regulator